MLDRKLAILCAAALTMGTPAFAQTTGPTPDDTANVIECCTRHQKGQS